MKRKFAMIAAFLVAMTGAIATKASKVITYVSLSNCSTVISACTGGTVDCGYVKGDCTHIQSKN